MASHTLRSVPINNKQNAAIRIAIPTDGNEKLHSLLNIQKTTPEVWTQQSHNSNSKVCTKKTQSINPFLIVFENRNYCFEIR